VSEQRSLIDTNLTDYEKTSITSEDRELFSKIKPVISQYQQALENDVFPPSRDGKAEEGRSKYLAIAEPAHHAAVAAVAALVELNRRNGAADGDEAQSRASGGSTTILILLLAAVASGCAIAWFMVKSINGVLMSAVNELAQGAEQIASAAQQVSSASQSLAQGSSEQAASIEETSSSSEEINSMAQQNSHNCGDAASLMTESQQSFARTDQALQHMVAAMSDINASSDKIARIIRVIDEIAFQTNILALNAAVEAARAGDAGMGFAVVADEVRNLAQRCAQAAKDTTSLIEESITKSNDGKQKTDLVAREIQRIIEQSSKVKAIVDNVNAGSMEQARGIDQVTKAIGQMGQVTQQTAATAEESAAAAEELSAQSESLQEIVVKLSSLVAETSMHARSLTAPVAVRR
jgi:methyl-accepting chemotaxis protein/methyl-accepting chemotaxis protein-1 (serine sensor receptor)